MRCPLHQTPPALPSPDSRQTTHPIPGAENPEEIGKTPQSPTPELDACAVGSILCTGSKVFANTTPTITVGFRHGSNAITVQSKELLLVYVLTALAVAIIDFLRLEG